MNRPSDTSPEADTVQLKLLRETPPWRKLQIMEDLINAARMVALSSIRQQFPQATEAEHKRLLADRLLGEELATKVYGPKPSHLGK